jgi:hypothetical protein
MGDSGVLHPAHVLDVIAHVWGAHIRHQIPPTMEKNTAEGEQEEVDGATYSGYPSQYMQGAYPAAEYSPYGTSSPQNYYDTSTTYASQQFYRRFNISAICIIF